MIRSTAALVAASVAVRAVDEGLLGRTLATAARMNHCSYVSLGGVWLEALWQSGNTLEALANLAIANGNSSEYDRIFENSFARTPAVVDKCFDDHQWWLLGWVRAYEATGNVSYLARAATVFDYVTEHAWTPQCGGGVLWVRHRSRR